MKKNKKLKINSKDEQLIRTWFTNELINNPEKYISSLLFENIKNILKYGKRMDLDVAINYNLPSELTKKISENEFWEILSSSLISHSNTYISIKKDLDNYLEKKWIELQSNTNDFYYHPNFWGIPKNLTYQYLTEYESDFSMNDLKKMKLKYVLHDYKRDNEYKFLNPLSELNPEIYSKYQKINIKDYVLKENIKDFIVENKLKENTAFELIYYLLNETHLYKLMDINDSFMNEIKKDNDDLNKEATIIKNIYDFHEDFCTLLESLITEPKCFSSLDEKKLYYIEQNFIKELSGKSIDLTGKHYTLHAGPTNAGKSYNALQSFYVNKKGCYLAPLRLLAYEIYDTLEDKNLFGSLLTGETKIVHPMSTHVSATVEMYQMLSKEHVDVLVIDECQMITDSQRGSAWLHAIVEANANEIHLISSLAAIPILSDYIEKHNGTIEVKEYQRLIPLEIMEEDISIYDLRKNDAIIAFSKNRILQLVAEIKAKTHFKVSYLYGMMPPEIKMKQMDDFRNGLTDIMVTTDVIAMGLNLPIQRVVFSETTKYNGEGIEVLSRPLFEQIAGRAGRFGLFDVGYVTFAWDAKRTDVINKRKTAGINHQVTKQPTYEEYLEFIDKSPENNLLDYMMFWEKNVEYDKTIYKKANISEIIGALKKIDEDLLNELSPKEQFFFAFLPYHNNRFTDFISNKLVHYYLNGNEFSSNQAKALIQECTIVNSFAPDIVLESQYSHLQTISQFAINTNNEILLELVKSEKKLLIDKWESTLQKVLKRKFS